MDVLDTLLLLCCLGGGWGGFRSGVWGPLLRLICLSVAYCGALVWHGVIESMLSDFVSPPLSSLTLDSMDGRMDPGDLRVFDMFYGALSFLVLFLVLIIIMRFFVSLAMDGPWKGPKLSPTMRWAGTGVGMFTSLLTACIILNVLNLFPGSGFAHEIEKAPVSRMLLNHTTVLRDHLFQVERVYPLHL